MEGISGQVRGLPDLKEALLAIPRELRRRALRLALSAGARVVRDEARRLAPVLRPGSPEVRRGTRRPGTLRKAISVRNSKIARRAGDVGVFVNVRPAKRGQSGAKRPTDPYYWQWQEFGWNPAGAATGGAGRIGKRVRRQLNRGGAQKSVPGKKFLQGAARKLDQALQVFIAKIGPAIQKFNFSGKNTQL